MNYKREKLALRLGDILTRLYRGEVLSISWLMEEYGVSEKTLRRDFHQRLVTAPIVKTDEGYRLDSSTRTSLPNIQKAFHETGLSTLLPSNYLIVENHSALLFKNPRTEDIEKLHPIFEKLTKVSGISQGYAQVIYIRTV